MPRTAADSFNNKPVSALLKAFFYLKVRQIWAKRPTGSVAAYPLLHGAVPRTIAMTFMRSASLWLPVLGDTNCRLI